MDQTYEHAQDQESPQVKAGNRLKSIQVRMHRVHEQHVIYEVCTSQEAVYHHRTQNNNDQCN